MKGSNLLLRKMKGSMGNVTAVVAADGETILKEKATSVYNPQSPAQTAQRGAFGLTIDFYKPILNWIRNRIKPDSVMQSAWNKACSLGTSLAKSNNITTVTALANQTLVSLGSIIKPSFVPVDINGPFPAGAVKTLTFNFNDLSSQDALFSTYQLEFLAYDPVNKTSRISAFNASAENLEGDCEVVPNPTGEHYIYACYVNPATGERSDSVLLGTASAANGFVSA